MTRIQLTYPLAAEFLSALRVPVATGTDELNFLCLEGAEPRPEIAGLVETGSNAPDLYNDCVVMLWQEQNPQADAGRPGVGEVDVLRVLRVLRVRVLRVLRATTQPGRFWTQIEPDARGAAHLVWGHHLYKRGSHKGHKALVPATGVSRVWRDRDRDFSQGLSEQVSEGRFGIHVHAGGATESIGRWSAGCIAIWGGWEGEPYLEFLDRVDKHPLKLFDLTLWGARDLERWVQDKEGWKPTLRLGIRSPWIAEVQRLLNRHLDADLIPDGDWGARTQEAFVRFQREKSLTVDGVCGPRSWEKLASL